MKNIKYEEILNKAVKQSLDPDEALQLFEESTDLSKAQELFKTASQVRNEVMGTTFKMTGGIASVLTCNLDPLCLYCPYWTLPKEPLSIEEILRAARYLKEHGIKEYHLSGGTTLGSDGQDMVDIVKAIRDQADADSVITVNCGAALSWESILKLKALGVTGITSSFETVNRALFKQVKPGDNFEAKEKLWEMVSQAGLDLGGGLMVGLGCTDCKEECSIVNGHKVARFKYQDYVDFIFHLKKYPNLKNVYLSRFFPYTGIPMAEHPRCSAMEGARVIAVMRLVLRNIDMRPANGWSYDDIPLWVAAGGGQNFIGIHITRQSGYKSNWYMSQALDYKDSLEYKNTIPTLTKFLKEMGMSVEY